MFNFIKKQNKGIMKNVRSEDVVSEIKPQLSDEEVIESEKRYLMGVRRIRDIIAPSSIAVSPDHIRIGSWYARSIYVTTFPRYISTGWFEPVIDHSATMDVSQFYYPVDPGIILKQLRNKVGEIEAQLISEAEKGAARDPISETALRDIEKLRDDITQGVEHFFQFGQYITMYAKSKEELDNLTDRIEGIIASKLVFTRRALYQTEAGFNSTLPLFSDQIKTYVNVNTSPIASAFPFVSSELTSDSGVLYGINRHNNSLVLFDRFSLQNANTVVFGTSGAGKSYAVKLEVLRSLMMGTDVIIIDPEHEYQYLAEAVGGAFVNISLNSEAKVNPFDLPTKIPEGTKPADIIRSAVITIKGLLRIMLGEFTHQEDSLIDRALIETYAIKDITSTADLSSVQSPTMRDLQQVLEGMEGGSDLSERLKKYTEGTFSGLLNHPTNVDINNQLVVFSVRDLEDELRPIAIYTIVTFIWNIVRSKLKKRILIIDEAWWLLQKEDSAKFLFALAKRGRKYYLGLTTITQDANDFLGSAYGQAIVTNSSMQLLMKQSPAGIDMITKVFQLTQGERYLLLESGVGEGIFFAGNKHVAIKVVASYTEDQLITSDPKQLLEIEDAKKEFDEMMSSGGNLQ